MSGKITRRTRSSAKNVSYLEQNIIFSSSDSISTLSDSDVPLIVRSGKNDKRTAKNKNSNAVCNLKTETGKPLSVPSTPRKQKSNINELDLKTESPVTPPKVKKVDDNRAVLSPSSLLNKLNLNSPPPKHTSGRPKFNSTYQNAKKALHNMVPSHMPGREKEHEELNNFIIKHLANKKSGSLYISGAPGTGKSASLSLILEKSELTSQCSKVYINCTAIKSSASIFSNIATELKLKTGSKTEKDCVASIENYITKSKKMLLLVLDELDQLESKRQSILYTIFEWPAKENSKILLIGIANALDLTDRVLPRLQSNCRLKPKLMHFAAYSKQQIAEIITNRLKEADVLDIFSPLAIQMIAGKVAAISGDLRRALDIGRRVIELLEQDNSIFAINGVESLANSENNPPNFERAKAIDVKQVMHVLNNVYGTSQTLEDDVDDTFPLQQKIILCTLLLVLKKGKNKDVTVGKLHDVYKKVCNKRNLLGVDQAEFVGLCSLIETRGIFRVSGKKEPRLHKINLQWNAEEVESALKDKKLISTILDDNFLEKI